MTSVINNPYDALYTNLKNRFTVIHDGAECTVGDFMMMKAGKRNTSDTSLPIATTYEHGKLATIVDYVSEKLTVKTPPIKDATIRRFPLRTSFSAVLSSVAACALVLSCGIFALSGSSALEPKSASAESGYVENAVETEADEIVYENVDEG